MSDETLRQQMGAKGKLKTREYSWEHVAQRVLDYYIGVIGESPQGK
jgi:glycosyltransferase involved in cell wall biosynthesis